MPLPLIRRCWVLLAIVTSVQAMTLEERRGYLGWMQSALPAAPEWSAWQAKTGELPPDFDALPMSNVLPDPLRFADGRTVNDPTGWRERRVEIRRALEQWVVGSLPPKPNLDHITLVSETPGPGYLIRTVRLEYGPGRKATAQVTVTIPAGRGPFPVLIGSGWTAALVRRGYIACSYDDSVDRPTNLPELYPDFDFATMGQRAWTAQLVVDYLCTLPEVDRQRIAMTGYSRGGKMAMIAAALDERIAAVIAGSTGGGGVLPWRLAGERGSGEGIESTTRMFPLWFHPRLRFFSGQEHRLPFDGNLLVALVAPRACLMQYGLNDEVSNPWASEQAFASAMTVYRMLGRPEALGLLRLPGFHGANDQERCLDWLDRQFGRSARPWMNEFLFSWNFDAWRSLVGETAEDAPRSRKPPLEVASLADWTESAEAVHRSIGWVLGEPPPRLAPGEAGRGFLFRRGPLPPPTSPVANPGQLAPDVPGWVIARNLIEFGWTDPDRGVADCRRIRFAGNLTGDLYYPKGTAEGAKLPTVIWLHGYSYPLGYMWVYRRDLHPILALVKAGYAVFAYDQCGFGSRMDESARFYDRWPRWSQLGRMVEDASAAIDTLEKDPVVDADRVYLLGYTLGGTVALHAAALDSRVRGVVAVCAFTPMRTDRPARGTTGVQRFSHERPLAPRLGLFVGREQEIPYDYDELIATIAPRPVLIVQPQRDRDAHPADVRGAMERARRVYAWHGAEAALALDEPDDYARFTTAMQDRAIQWMATHFRSENPTSSVTP